MAGFVHVGLDEDCGGHNDRKPGQQGSKWLGFGMAGDNAVIIKRVK
jgi:hypothetical protein